MAKLTRKEYETFAEIIRRLPDPASRDQAAQAFAQALAGTNPQFDQARFVAAAVRPLNPEAPDRLINGTYYPDREPARKGIHWLDRLAGATEAINLAPLPGDTVLDWQHDDRGMDMGPGHVAPATIERARAEALAEDAARTADLRPYRVEYAFPVEAGVAGTHVREVRARDAAAALDGTRAWALATTGHKVMVLSVADMTNVPRP